MHAWFDNDPKRFTPVLEENYHAFSSLLRSAEDYANNGDCMMGAIYAEIAAGFAMGRHPGLFASSAIERLLLNIGRASTPARTPRAPDRVARVLHLCTYVRGVGGHSRLVARWIRQDSKRSHSLALTRQTWSDIPSDIRDAVEKSGGQIHVINSVPGNLLSWARRLRRLAETADIVVNHTSPSDTLPMLAFAHADMPVVFLNHADHTFWIGAQASTLVASVRTAGAQLCVQRRMVEPSRSTILPTLISAPQRRTKTNDAKRRLALPEERVVLLSAARAEKFRTVNGVSYADAHVPLLQRHKDAILVVVGPGRCADWEAAIELTNGRIIAYDERPDLTLFLEAADILVSSFPFTSTTVSLEGAAQGLPYVYPFPYTSASEIFGAEMAGTEGKVLRARTYDEYFDLLSGLIADGAYRRATGEAAREQVLDTHSGAGWQRRLEAVYEQALSLPVAPSPVQGADTPNLDEPDTLLPFVMGQSLDMDEVIRARSRMLPLGRRASYWLEQARLRGIAPALLGDALKSLMPEWALRLRSRKASRGLIL